MVLTVVLILAVMHITLCGGSGRYALTHLR